MVDDLVDGLSTKFGVNLIDSFWHRHQMKTRFTDAERWTTDDGHLQHGISSTDSQAELKSNSLYLPWRNAPYRVWLKLNENVLISRLSKFLASDFFAICTEWLQTEIKRPDLMSTLHIEYLGPWVPNFHPFRSAIRHFPDIPHFMISYWLPC